MQYIATYGKIWFSSVALELIESRLTYLKYQPTHSLGYSKNIYKYNSISTARINKTVETYDNLQRIIWKENQSCSFSAFARTVVLSQNQLLIMVGNSLGGHSQLSLFGAIDKRVRFHTRLEVWLSTTKILFNK